MKKIKIEFTINENVLEALTKQMAEKVASVERPEHFIFNSDAQDTVSLIVLEKYREKEKK